MQLGAHPDSFAVSLYATASAEHEDILYTVLRAGHLTRDPAHHIKRDHFPGHELILCLHGEGFVQIRGVRHSVKAGDFVWINCHHPHEHGAVASDPWEVFWVRVDGPRLEQIYSLLGADERPVLHQFDATAAESIFRDVFHLLKKESPETAPLVHVAVAQLVAMALCARQNNTRQETIPFPLKKAIEHMRLYYFEPLTIADLAQMSGMSPSHFARVFKSAFGESPITWLRHERIRQAKRRLLDSDDPIQQIGEQVGYRDRFFFSKDFKKSTGLTPREFRRREVHHAVDSADGKDLLSST